MELKGGIRFKISTKSQKILTVKLKENTNQKENENRNEEKIQTEVKSHKESPQKETKIDRKGGEKGKRECEKVNRRHQYTHT